MLQALCRMPPSHENTASAVQVGPPSLPRPAPSRSGHGISGNARLSLRSFVATCAFMLSGMLAARLSGVAAVFGMPPGLAPLAPLSPLSPTGVFGVTLLVVTVTTWLLLSAAARQLDQRVGSPSALGKELADAPALEQKPDSAGVEPPAAHDAQKLAALSTATDLFSGFLFALGLGVSGMAKPSKVAGRSGVPSCGAVVWVATAPVWL